MTLEAESIDITDRPELAQLADEVRRTMRPRVLRRGDEEVALILPLGTAKITPVPYNPALEEVLAGLPADDPVVRTAGALHTDQPFLGYDVEKALAEQAIGRDIVAQWSEE